LPCGAPVFPPPTLEPEPCPCIPLAEVESPLEAFKADVSPVCFALSEALAVLSPVAVAALEDIVPVSADSLLLVGASFWLLPHAVKAAIVIIANNFFIMLVFLKNKIYEL